MCYLLGVVCKPWAGNTRAQFEKWGQEQKASSNWVVGTSGSSLLWVLLGCKEAAIAICDDVLV